MHLLLGQAGPGVGAVQGTVAGDLGRLVQHMPRCVRLLGAAGAGRVHRVLQEFPDVGARAAVRVVTGRVDNTTQIDTEGVGHERGLHGWARSVSKRAALY